MEMRAARRLAKDRKKINPINLHDLGLYDENMAPNIHGYKNKNKNSNNNNADISPMDINLSINWDMVGGLQDHIQKLKEMVILPLLYQRI